MLDAQSKRLVEMEIPDDGHGSDSARPTKRARMSPDKEIDATGVVLEPPTDFISDEDEESITQEPSEASRASDLYLDTASMIMTTPKNPRINTFYIG